MMATKRESVRLQFIAGLVLSLFILASPVLPYSEKPDMQTYEVKAAYLFNFAKLTEWPDGAFSATENHFEICVLGADPFEESLNLLSGRTVNGRNVLIKRIHQAQEAAQCNLLFISPSETDHLPKIMSHVMNNPVLTVSDIEDFDDAGGIITLFLKNNRLRFRVNLEAARKAKLKISSYLLEVAETVTDKGR